MGVQPSDHVLDCGCGIGGPLRNIGRFTGARVTGVTLNQYQVDRGNALCAQAGLDVNCRLVQADFHHMPFECVAPTRCTDTLHRHAAPRRAALRRTRCAAHAGHSARGAPGAVPVSVVPVADRRAARHVHRDGTFDHCYSIEACCHSPKRADVYAEVYRCLKPGGYFISYEWCLTDKHDPGNPDHLLSKKRIEEGDGLPDICHTSACDVALNKVGFEVVECRDAALAPNPGGEPWYKILTPSYYSLFRLQFTPWGARRPRRPRGPRHPPRAAHRRTLIALPPPPLTRATRGVRAQAPS